MPRSAKLNRIQVGKHTYWTTEAGGQRVYLGKVGEVSRKDAERAFADHLKTIRSETPAQRELRISATCSIWELCDRHNLWVQANRAVATYRQRRSILQAFCNHRVPKPLYGTGRLIGDLDSDRIALPHATDYLQRWADPVTRRNHVIAIKAAFNWAATPEEADGGGLLPETTRPLRHLKRPHVPPKDLSEYDLLTPEEYDLLLRYAAYDTTKVRAGTGRWRKRSAEERAPTDDGPYQVFEELLVCMHAVGPRTSEPLNCRVREFNRRTRQLTLGRHKRANTQRNTTLRQLVLSDDAFEIVARRCRDRSPLEPIFPLSNGGHWTQERFNERFREVKAIIRERHEAGEEETLVRDHITPYSFRDLYISELLMIGTPPFQVSKMAGTSLQEIERSYGHFFNADLAAAQAALDRVRAERKKKPVVLQLA